MPPRACTSASSIRTRRSGARSAVVGLTIDGHGTRITARLAEATRVEGAGQRGADGPHRTVSGTAARGVWRAAGCHRRERNAARAHRAGLGHAARAGGRHGLRARRRPQRHHRADRAPAGTRRALGHRHSWLRPRRADGRRRPRRPSFRRHRAAAAAPVSPAVPGRMARAARRRHLPRRPARRRRTARPRRRSARFRARLPRT